MQLGDVLELNGQEFVEAAYNLILRRMPDSEGLNHYLQMLRKGKSKRRVISDLARTKNETVFWVPGLEELIQAEMSARLSLSHLVPIFKRKARQSLDIHFSKDEERCLSPVNRDAGLYDLQVGANNLSVLDVVEVEYLNKGGVIKPYVIKPVSGIEPSASEFRFKSVTPDPQMQILFASPLKPGWYEFQFKVSLTRPIGIAEIFIKCLDCEISPFDSITFPYANGALQTVVVHLDRMTRHIRFDPLMHVGICFDVDVMRVKALDVDQVKAAVAASLESIASSIYNSNAVNKLFDGHDVDLIYGKYRRILRAQSLKLLPDYDYFQWIDVKERAWRKGMAEFASKFSTLICSHLPQISIVMAAYNTPTKWLDEAIESVVKQSYPNWELCIADDCSSDVSVKICLEKWRGRDKRIKVVLRDKNGHISAATNSALDQVTGDWVCFMDHDDTLDEHALAALYKVIEKKPDTVLIYSDEDKIDEYGNRSGPHFKSDWNPDLLLSHNYITHLTAVNVKQIDKNDLRLDSTVNGSQDYDFLLRLMPKLNQKNVVHIPWILYHWRAHAGSTAMASSAKSYTADAGLLALNNYISRNRFNATCCALGDNFYKVSWLVPEPQPLISIIIPTKDKADLLRMCVDSIAEKTTYQNYEIIVVDNNSEEGETYALLRQYRNKSSLNFRVLTYDKKFNWSAINNFAAKEAKGELLLFLNNDIEVITPEWLEELAGQALRPEIGCTGSLLLYPNMTIQHAGIIVGLGGAAGHSHKHFHFSSPGYYRRLEAIQNLSGVTGACLMIKRSVFEEAGGFDESLAVAFNDVEFCLRVREMGYRNVYTSFAKLFHHESISRGYEDTPAKQIRFAQEVARLKQKWGGLLQSDPYYSPHLTTSREDFSLEVPERRL